MKQEIYVQNSPWRQYWSSNCLCVAFKDPLDPTSIYVHSCDDNLLIDCVISVLFIVLKLDKYKLTVPPLVKLVKATSRKE